MCGISGFVGNKKGNIDKLKILGLYNTTRGTDSCGMALNNEVVKGVGTTANFSNFIEEKVIETYDDHENYTVLIHTRNASMKSTKEDPECAHPFEIKTKKGKTILIGMHNGVITNESEIAKKYGVKEEKVDSKTLLSILAKGKTDKRMLDVLKDYEGAAALAWYYPDEPNTLYLWKGASKKWSNSTEYEEERPLYVYRVKDDNGKFTDQFYFSSIKESLLAIGGDLGFKETDEDKEPSIKSIETNCIIKITPGDKYRITTIKRIQESTTYNGNVTSYSKVGTAHIISTKKSKKQQQQEGKEKMLKAFSNYPATKMTNAPLLSTNGGVLIDNEPFLHDFHGAKNKVYFRAGRYWQNGHMLGGNEKNRCVSRKLDIEGYPEGHKLCDQTGVDTYYFFQGLLLIPGQEHVDAIEEKCKKKLVWQVDGKNLNLYEIHKHIFGFCQNLRDTHGNAKESVNTWARGNYYPMFDYDRVYKYENGFFIGAEYKKLPSDLKLKMFDSFEKGEAAKDFVSPIIILPETQPKLSPLSKVRHSAAISEAVNAITEAEEDKIFNHCYDAITSLKVAVKELEKVEDKEKYKSLIIMMRGAHSTLSAKIKVLENTKSKEEEDGLQTSIKGPLYS